MRLRSFLVGGAAVAGLLGGMGVWSAQASDHDDGENDNKARALNITDLYVFREDWQTGNAADAGNLIAILNVNPRSLPRQQYYFSSNARYELHFSRVADTNVAPTGLDDVVLRFEFAEPDTSNNQAITVTWVEGGTETVATGAASTTNLEDSTADTALAINNLTVGANTIDVFAGHREDPFFFDVESFFVMRGTGTVAIKGTADAPDFTAGYNVNSIVARIPIAALAGAGAANKFDVWATVSLAMEQEDGS